MKRVAFESILSLACVLFAVAVLLFGCGSGDRTLAEADPDAVAAEPTLDQVFVVVQRECTPCHKEGDTAPRLETRDDVANNAEPIYNRAVARNDMPPGAWPRLTSEEKLLIARWAGEADAASPAPAGGVK